MWWIIGGAIVAFLLIGFFCCWVFIAGTDQSRKRARESRNQKTE